MIHCFHAMGTEWWIRADVDPVPAETLVRSLEARLSRFVEDSALSRLNRARQVEDPVIARIVDRALQIREQTGGAFDPSAGAAVVAAGYDRSFERVVGSGALDRRRPVVTVHRDVVTLDGEGLLDLGGIAKGWTVDRVGELLDRRGATAWLVDGGGDIRVRGRWPVGIGELGTELVDRAVATSSTEKRRWPGGHHLVDPRTGGSSESGVLTAVVIAGDAATADALATAIVVDPGLATRLDVPVLLKRATGTWQRTSDLEVMA